MHLVIERFGIVVHSLDAVNDGSELIGQTFLLLSYLVEQTYLILLVGIDALFVLSNCFKLVSHSLTNAREHLSNVITQRALYFLTQFNDHF